jgi:hypothetical protein
MDQAMQTFSEQSSQVRLLQRLLAKKRCPSTMATFSDLVEVRILYR